MKLTRLTPAAFDHLADQTSLGDQAKTMARSVLVDGRSQTEVATEYGMTRQRVNLAVGSIKRAYSKSATPGSSWVTLEVELPDTLALALTCLAEELRTCSDEKTRKRTVAHALRSIETARRSLT
jgi:hypothetical protein